PARSAACLGVKFMPRPPPACVCRAPALLSPQRRRPVSPSTGGPGCCILAIGSVSWADSGRVAEMVANLSAPAETHPRAKETDLGPWAAYVLGHHPFSLYNWLKKLWLTPRDPSGSEYENPTLLAGFLDRE